MTLPKTLKLFLDRADVALELVSHPATSRIQQAAALVGVEQAQVARGVLLQGERQLHLVVLPADRLLDFASVRSMVGEELELTSPELARRVFFDCSHRLTPVLGQPYGLTPLVDESLFELPLPYLGVGREDVLLRLESADFAKLFGHCRRGCLSHAPEIQGADSAPAASPVLAHLQRLPPLPGTATQILRLAADPLATAADIARVVEQDPSLAAQVLRHARSSFFGYQGKLETVHDAVHRVLGFDLVIGLTLGLAASRPFRIPLEGPLGLMAYWRHATYSGALVQALIRQMPASRRPQPGLAHLATLLHNFGFLVLGHLFPPEFAMLNRLVAAKSRAPIEVAESEVLAMGEAREVMEIGHARLGAELLQRWDMPVEVVVAAAHHHDPAYDGDHAEYAALVLLAGRLLSQHGCGDADGADLPDAALRRLGLNHAAIAAALDQVLGAREELDEVVRLVAA